MFQILVVEDNKNFRTLITAKLKAQGYSVLQAKDGKEALEVSEHNYVDLYVCDIMMPVMDGFSLIEAIRGARDQTPILIISAKEDFEDKERGFRLGTDDYMVKPIDWGELVLRVSALLRRAQISNEQQIVIDSTFLDFAAFTVTHKGNKETLPKKEFLLLFKLLSNIGHIFTRQQLLDEIWGIDADVDERTVDTHVKKLRKRFENVPDFEIKTLRGLGYRADKNAENNNKANKDY